MKGLEKYYKKVTVYLQKLLLDYVHDKPPAVYHIPLQERERLKLRKYTSCPFLNGQARLNGRLGNIACFFNDFARFFVILSTLDFNSPL